MRPRTQADAAAIVAICRSLSDDVAAHFRTDEAEMACHRFAALDAHRQEHERVLEFVRGELARIQGAVGRSDLIDAALELKARLIERLFRFDVGYKPLLLSSANR